VNGERVILQQIYDEEFFLLLRAVGHCRSVFTCNASCVVIVLMTNNFLLCEWVLLLCLAAC